MSKEEENQPVDRRSGKERRRKFNFSRFIYKGIDRSLERRGFKKRRSKSKKKQEDVDKGEGKETDLDGFIKSSNSPAKKQRDKKGVSR